MAASVNSLLVDEAIRHQIALLQYSNDVVRRMIGLLNDTDAQVLAQLYDVLGRMDAGSFTVQRLQSLLGSLRALNADAFGQVNREMAAELLDFAKYETQYQNMLLDVMTPPTVHIASVNADQVYAAAMSEPFQGTLLQDALANISDARANAIQRTIAQGFVENQTIDQIVTDVRGTAAQGWTNGVIDMSRRETTAVVRTSIGHMASFVADEGYQANNDLIKAVQWVSTIDLRTTPFCQARDGLTYSNDAQHRPLGHAYPWGGGPGAAHWNCRSHSVPVLKSWRELGIDAPEFWAGSTRATMDGQVPEAVTYQQWLKSQTADRQDAVLGPTRGALLRQGGLRLQDMYSRDGQYLTLDQLRANDSAAFKRAGL